VYVMSGLGGPQLRRQALEAGAAEFLVKPLDRAMLARVLGRSRAGQRERPRTGTDSPASSQTAS
jgi:FixJ family two-component response regulator